MPWMAGQRGLPRLPKTGMWKRKQKPDISFAILLGCLTLKPQLVKITVSLLATERHSPPALAGAPGDFQFLISTHHPATERLPCCLQHLVSVQHLGRWAHPWNSDCWLCIGIWLFADTWVAAQTRLRPRAALWSSAHIQGNKWHWSERRPTIMSLPLRSVARLHAKHCTRIS